MSQLGDVSDSSLHRVLKWVNLGPKTWGSWNESTLGAKRKGLERSQFVMFCHISHCTGSWKESILMCLPSLLYRLLLGSWKESILMKCHEMLFKLFTNSSQSSQRSSARNVEGLDDFLSANLSFLYGARGEVSWSGAASPVSSADDEVMRVQCVMNNERLRCNEALGASTQAVSLKVTLFSGSIGHCMVSVPDGHFLPLFWPGVLKWVISVTFELFGLFCVETFSKGCAAVTDFASNLSLSGRCLLPLTSVAQGTFYFVPWWTLLYCGSLPWRFLSLSMGDILDTRGSPFLLVCQLLGCLWLG